MERENNKIVGHIYKTTSECCPIVITLQRILNVSCEHEKATRF